MKKSTRKVYVVVEGTKTDWGNHPYSTARVFFNKRKAVEHAKVWIRHYKKEGARYTPFVILYELEDEGVLITFVDTNPEDFGGKVLIDYEGEDR